MSDATDAIRDPSDEYNLDDDDVQGHVTHPPVVAFSDFLSDRYKMNHSQRGKALIINNKTFNSLETREGTDVDASSMCSLFSTLGFEDIVQKNDLTVEEMKTLMTDAGKEIYSDKDCVVCVILSHGKDGDEVCGSDGTVAIEDLLAPFKGDKCPTLAGKPKLFFIQACRGSQTDEGVDAFVGEGDSDPETEGGVEPEPEARTRVEVRRIPAEADFLVAYSVTPGYLSWRNEVRGSWFIQAISEVFNSQWKEKDVLTMMTSVNKKVAYEFRTERDGNKQMPCITSMLTKYVYF